MFETGAGAPKDTRMKTEESHKAEAEKKVVKKKDGASAEAAKTVVKSSKDGAQKKAATKDAAKIEKESIRSSCRKETKKARDARVARILALLDAQYGTDIRCWLDHGDAWQLLVATILSAQCTDARVNIVTKDLFVKYPNVASLASADLAELEQDIRSTGFYHNKAKNIIACAKTLMEKYGGEVPSGLDELVALPGVGRKTANVIRGNIYGTPSIVVDTHVKRISRKLGLTDTDDPEKAEYQLMEILPQDHWILWNLDIITLGRTICIARREKCGECFLAGECPSCSMHQRTAYQGVQRPEP